MSLFRRLTACRSARTVLPTAVAAALLSLLGPAKEGASREPQARRADAPQAASALVTRRDLNPPRPHVYRTSSRTAPGFIFLGPKRVYGAKRSRSTQQGPMIVDDRGRVRFFMPMPKGQTAWDVRVQEYKGRPVLTWWQGRAVFGSGNGAGYIYDDRYRLVKRVLVSGGARADIHEFRLTPRGTALFIKYEQKRHDLRPVGGKRDDWIVDGVIEEVDVETGEIVFRWSALDHIRLTESYEHISKRYGRSWDYVHFNSVAEDTDGNLLVSARHTWAVYKIDKKTGKILWRLGGKRSDFRMGRGTSFAWQHDAVAEAPGVVRIFNNDAASKPRRPYSTVLSIRVDTERKTATRVGALRHPRRLSSGTQGGSQRLANGNIFVGWGSQGHFSEFTHDGRILFDARVPRGYDSYRAYRMQWSARPPVPPRVDTRPGRPGRTNVYVSWNGATDVTRWRVLAGAERDELEPAATAAWSGLETRISITGKPRYVAVQALDDDGEVLSTSATVAVRR
jgi:hypothetical protein